MQYQDFSSIEIEIQGEYPKFTGSYPTSAIYKGRTATENELLTLEHMQEFHDSLSEYYTNACTYSSNALSQISRGNLGSATIEKCGYFMNTYSDSGKWLSYSEIKNH